MELEDVGYEGGCGGGKERKEMMECAMCVENASAMHGSSVGGIGASMEILRKYE